MDRVMVPVNPGPGPVIAPDDECVLCASSDGLRMWVVVGHSDTVVCVDTLGCVVRAVGIVVAS
jgi:hypothetical protein